MEHTNTFGRFIRERRQERRWSLRYAAREIGITHPRLAELEAGFTYGTGKRTGPSREMVKRIASAYQLSTESLLELAGYAREHPDLEPDDVLMLELFHKLDAPRRRTALQLLKALDDERARPMHRGGALQAAESQGASEEKGRPGKRPGMK